MRGRKRLNAYPADGKIARHDMHLIGKCLSSVDILQRSLRSENRQAVLLGQCLEAAHMIDVFMGDKHRIDRL